MVKFVQGETNKALDYAAIYSASDLGRMEMVYLFEVSSFDIGQLARLSKITHARRIRGHGAIIRLRD